MEMTTTTTNDPELGSCALAAQGGVAMMRAAEGQWAAGALRAAEALYTARMRLKNDIAFGQWCDCNGLGEDVISKNERAALIKVGSNLPYWRARIAEAKSRSIRMIVEQNPPSPEVSQSAGNLPSRRKTPPTPKAAAKPKQPRFHPWSGAGKLQLPTAQELGKPMGAEAFEQAPGQPPGVTKIDAYHAERPRIQLWVPNEAERIRVRGQFVELTGFIRRISKGPWPDPAEVDKLAEKDAKDIRQAWRLHLRSAMDRLAALETELSK